MDYRFFGQKSQPPVAELDDGWEVLADPRWPGGLYRQRSEPVHPLPLYIPKAISKRQQLWAFSSLATSVKGLAVDLMA